MNKKNLSELSVSEILTNYEKTLDTSKQVAVRDSGKVIYFNSANLTAKEIHEHIDSLTKFIRSDEGKVILFDKL